MTYDCGFTRESNWFRYRAAAIIIEDGCVLFAGNEREDYLYSIGGGVHMGETAEAAVLREVFEETGYTLISWKFRGIVTFSQEGYGTEYMCLYTADGFTGTMKECDEGKLKWIPKDKIWNLRLWEGDKIFLKLLNEDVPFFSLKLSYKGDELVETVLDGRPLESQSY